MAVGLVRGQQGYSAATAYRPAGGFFADVGPSGQCPPAMSSRACLPDSPKYFPHRSSGTPAPAPAPRADPPLTSFPRIRARRQRGYKWRSPQQCRDPVPHIPVRIFSLLPVPNKEQQRKVSSSLLLLSLVGSSFPRSSCFSRGSSVRACVVLSFVRACLGGDAANLGWVFLGWI